MLGSDVNGEGLSILGVVIVKCEISLYDGRRP